MKKLKFIKESDMVMIKAASRGGANTNSLTSKSWGNETLVTFNKRIHRFEALPNVLQQQIKLNAPLTVIVQVTRRCNLRCIFCSESDYLPDPSFAQLQIIRDNLIGVQRIYLSGGEPLLRYDIVDIFKLYREKFPILGLPTNAIFVTDELAKKLSGLVDYVNVGLDGPRNINNQIRGHYDEILNGITKLLNAEIEVSLSMVVIRKNIDCISYVCQIADILGIKKLKLVLPVPRGRGLNLPVSELCSTSELLNIFKKIKKEKVKFGWTPALTLTTWSPELEGYAILVYPNGKVVAWPVFGENDCVKEIGNLFKEDIQTIWQKYPYRENHIKKYLGDSIHMAVE
jgi:MoaA/NifB/PqqE/SkfB family radical SAM enzyme